MSRLRAAERRIELDVDLGESPETVVRDAVTQLLAGLPPPSDAARYRVFVAVGKKLYDRMRQAQAHQNGDHMDSVHQVQVLVPQGVALTPIDVACGAIPAGVVVAVHRMVVR